MDCNPIKWPPAVPCGSGCPEDILESLSIGTPVSSLAPVGAFNYYCFKAPFGGTFSAQLLQDANVSLSKDVIALATQVGVDAQCENARDSTNCVCAVGIDTTCCIDFGSLTVGEVVLLGVKVPDITGAVGTPYKLTIFAGEDCIQDFNRDFPHNCSGNQHFDIGCGFQAIMFANPFYSDCANCSDDPVAHPLNSLIPLHTRDGTAPATPATAKYCFAVPYDGTWSIGITQTSGTAVGDFLTLTTIEADSNCENQVNMKTCSTTTSCTSCCINLGALTLGKLIFITVTNPGGFVDANFLIRVYPGGSCIPASANNEPICTGDQLFEIEPHSEGAQSSCEADDIIILNFGCCDSFVCKPPCASECNPFGQASIVLTFDIAGVTNQDCSSCGGYNGTVYLYNLAETGLRTCAQWWGDCFRSCRGTQNWVLSIIGVSLATGQVLLQLTADAGPTIIVTYVNSQPFECCGSTEFVLSLTPGPTSDCSNWPTNLTITTI